MRSAVARLESTLEARRVFSAPIERDGTVVALAASIGGGGGGEETREREGQSAGTGTGGGFGIVARPAGAFVIKRGGVRWRPAIDVNRVILGGQLVAITGLLVLRSIFRLSRTEIGRPHGRRGDRRLRLAS